MGGYRRAMEGQSEKNEGKCKQISILQKLPICQFGEFGTLFERQFVVTKKIQEDKIMTLDKFTIKAQEAIQQAVNRAQLGGQQVIEPVHILKGVMEKAKDVCTFLFQKLGINAQQIELLVDQELKHLPHVEGAGQPYLSNEGNQVLVKATDLAQKQGDEFVSVEPLLLALLTVNSTAARILKDAGCTEKELMKAIQELRQGQKVQSQSADDNYQSLEKYANRRWV